MLRNVQHLTPAGRISLQSYLTANGIFPQQQQQRQQKRQQRQPNRGMHHSNFSKMQVANGKVAANMPSLPDLTKSLPKQSLPYYRKLLAFDECLAHNSFFDQKTSTVHGGSIQFWDAIDKVMPLYEELSITGELTEQRMDDLISLLRNGIRMRRFELGRMNKNEDRDVKSPLQQVQSHLKVSLLKIGEDIVKSASESQLINVSVSQRGLTHLFKSYSELNLSDEAANLWYRCKSIPELNHLVTSESVLGVILSILVEGKNFNFDEVNAIYKNVKNSRKNRLFIHSELQIAMLKACLLKDKIDDALIIFKEITSGTFELYDKGNMTPTKEVMNYMTQAHLSFVGYCQDFETANVFFNGSFDNTLPYFTPIQLNSVKKFMFNTWSSTKDFDKVTDIWKRTWKYFEDEKKTTNIVSSSLNDAYLDIFFDKYHHFDANATNALRDLIGSYAKIKPMDEPFFNCLMTKSIKWGQLDIFQSILEAGDLYNFPKSNVYHRCILKASGSVPLGIDQTFHLFERLLNSNIQMGSDFITNADWHALRDATIKSPEYLSGEKIDLYFKLFKLCCPHFLPNIKNFKSYMSMDYLLDNRYGDVFNQIGQVDTSTVDLTNQLKWFKLNDSVINYWSQRGVDILANRDVV